MSSVKSISRRIVLIQSFQRMYDKSLRIGHVRLVFLQGSIDKIAFIEVSLKVVVKAV